MNSGSIAKRLARTALHRCGGLSVVRLRRRSELRILVYHRFPLEFREQFESHCAHLWKDYRPVSMGKVARWLAAGEPLPENAVAITVDDGYRDFHDIAWPILSRYGLPVTVFLTTGFLDGQWMWVDRVRYAFEHASVGRAAALEMIRTLKQHPNCERLRAIEELPRLLGVEIPEHPPEEYAPLSWDQVRQLARAGVEFGGHSVTHPILSRIETEAELCAEIAGSKQRIESELNAHVLHFCYPNGGPADISDAAVLAVEEAGYSTAVTMQHGLNSAGADPLLLSRLPSACEYPDDYFQELAAGMHLPKNRPKQAA